VARAKEYTSKRQERPAALLDPVVQRESLANRELPPEQRVLRRLLHALR